ncbi:hypothetical protein [Rhizobium sullae]|uniref:hypothetical protein n=1 Tax=Rhizobium sullae TaxID=50338 RepID=UPI001A9DF5CB|nr:hypothetical protein [Rhizobium sullae]
MEIGEALISVGGKRYLILDPFKESEFRDAGWEAIRSAQLDGIATLFREKSQIAPPRLAAEGLLADVPYSQGRGATARQRDIELLLDDGEICRVYLTVSPRNVFLNLAKLANLARGDFHWPLENPPAPHERSSEVPQVQQGFDGRQQELKSCRIQSWPGA